MSPPPASSVQPCSELSRRGLAGVEHAESDAHRPALTAPARGCLRIAGPGRRNGLQVEQRNWDRSKATRRPRLPGSSARSFSSYSTRPRQDRRGAVMKCLEIAFGPSSAFSANGAFTILWKERTMNRNWLVGNVEGFVMARQKRRSPRPLRDNEFGRAPSVRPSPILCWRSTSRQAHHRGRLAPAASAQDFRHPRLLWGVS
jgi:hypothetical protein